MSNNKGVNITKYLLGNSIKPSTIQPIIDSGFITSGKRLYEGSNLSRIFAYIFAILIVLLVILLFVNFFITPIFRLKPGGSGIIPIPGFDDGKLYWNRTSPGIIQNKDLPIVSQTFDYTINLDVFIENPLQFSRTPRIFFNRGGVQKQNPTGDTMLSILDNYNIAAALLPDTNDILVSVLNVNNNMENIVVPNAPVQQPFRLTMVLMQQALEVYINGQLMKTRLFSAPPKNVIGDIHPSSGIEINVTKVRNLKLWPRILTVREIKDSTPSLSRIKQFGGGEMTTAPITNVSDRYSKLAVESIQDTMQFN